MPKSYSIACERNREPILQKLKDTFANISNVLEIGSGTGQHAVYFAQHLPHITWQTSDLPENHPSIQAWLQEASLDNTKAPLTLDVCSSQWPVDKVDGIYMANVCHIMSWEAVQAMFVGMGKILTGGAVVCVYGPFNYNGQFTSKSNERFDEYLRSVDSQQGIRDFEKMMQLAEAQGMSLLDDFAMPANNRLLCWQKK